MWNPHQPLFEALERCCFLFLATHRAMNVLKSCRCGHHSLISLQLCSYKLILPTPPNLAEKSFLLIFSAGQYLRYLLELLNGTLQPGSKAVLVTQPQMIGWYKIKPIEWDENIFVGLWVGKKNNMWSAAVLLRSLRPLIELWPKLWKLIHQPSRRERDTSVSGYEYDYGAVH